MKNYLGKEVIFNSSKGIVEGITDDNYILVRIIEGGDYYTLFTLRDIINNNGNINTRKSCNRIKYLRPLYDNCAYSWLRIDDTHITIRNINIMETE